jgi:hypothetical protein
MEDFKVGWHLDKRVSGSLLLAIIIQTSTFVWFLSGLENRVSNVETSIVVMSEDIADQDDEIGTIRMDANNRSVALGRIDVQLDNIEEILNRIEDRYERDNP